MDDKHPEAVRVELGGESRRLKLGPAAFRLARVRHGTTFTMAELGAPTLDTLAALVWVALLPDHPDLTEGEAMAWLAASDDEGAVIGRVVEALHRMSDSVAAGLENPLKPRTT